MHLVNNMKHVNYIFSSESIKKHTKDGHNFRHIGLVQIGAKPLTR